MDHFAYGEARAREAEIRRVAYESMQYTTAPNESLDQLRIADLEQRLSDAEDHIDYITEVLSTVINEAFNYSPPDAVVLAINDYPKG